MKPAKFSKYILCILLLISTVIGGFFFFGGKVLSVGNAQIPIYSDLFLYLLVALVGGALAVAVFALIARLAERFRRSPKEAVRSVIGFFILAFILFFCWLCGSGTLLHLQGYSGVYNTPCWLRLTDMFLYSTYFLMGVAVLLIVGFYVARKIR